MVGLIGFGAIEDHLVNNYGYLFALTLGAFESLVGALLVGSLTYLSCRVILCVCDVFRELSECRRHRKNGGQSQG
jgi:hypothetical protein